MRNFALCLVMIGAGLVFAQSQPARPLSPFEQELIANENRFFEALQTRDVAFVSQSVGDDFKGVARNGDFYEKDELVGEAREGLPKGFRIYDIHVIRLNDSSAVVAYNEIAPGSHPRYLHMSDSWSKENGQWKLKFQQATPNLWSAADLD